MQPVKAGRAPPAPPWYRGGTEARGWSLLKVTQRAWRAQAPPPTVAPSCAHVWRRPPGHACLYVRVRNKHLMRRECVCRLCVYMWVHSTHAHPRPHRTPLHWGPGGGGQSCAQSHTASEGRGTDLDAGSFLPGLLQECAHAGDSNGPCSSPSTLSAWGCWPVRGSRAGSANTPHLCWPGTAGCFLGGRTCPEMRGCLPGTHDPTLRRGRDRLTASWGGPDRVGVGSGDWRPSRDWGGTALGPDAELWTHS